DDPALLGGGPRGRRCRRGDDLGGDARRGAAAREVGARRPLRPGARGVLVRRRRRAGRRPRPHAGAAGRGRARRRPAAVRRGL
ncbi:MAG: hypothetical protein AVDCRST_MAG16-2584, partial [uncultured Frankineae bacterium]